MQLMWSLMLALDNFVLYDHRREIFYDGTVLASFEKYPRFSRCLVLAPP